MKTLLGCLVVTCSLLPVQAAEWHVAQTGKDANLGTADAPFRTIGRAAETAQPGDTVTVHAGVYRERVVPPRGGESDARRIVYQAAPGEKVEIKGSEVVKGWTRVQDDVWKVTLPNAFFGGFNPYSDVLRGDWFDAQGRVHHSGAVYLDGTWLTEAARREDLVKPGGAPPQWFATVDRDATHIEARFPGADPNERTVEINVRRTVFYPDKPGRNFITLRGFTLRHAATPWAPPTAEQVGLVGTHWSRGWVIEDNVISHSRCSGITLGKHGDEFDNTSANTAEGYVKTIERAHKVGWDKNTIGGHVVRRNTISDCEQTGICGSLGAVFSTITDNHIFNIWARRQFSGAEMAGIKIHAAIDTLIQGNHIHTGGPGIWLDWMAQGTRVSGNLCYDNNSYDLFVEVDHGPFLVDNNLFLSRTSLLDMSEGGAYVHNLFAGQIITHPEPNRATPYHPAHATVVAGLERIKGGDDRFFNNIFVGGGPAKPAGKPQPANGFGLAVYDAREYPLLTGGNVYYHGARPYAREVKPVVRPDYDPRVRVVTGDGHVYLHLALDQALSEAGTAPVTTEALGKARVSGLPYENTDGKPVRIATDFFGKPRKDASPTAGPFEGLGSGPQTLKVR